MNLIRTSSTLVLGLMFIFISIACSSSHKGIQSPIEPSTNLTDISTSPSNGDESGRDIVAVYDAEIDLTAKTFTVTPANRESTYHLPVSNSFPNVVKIMAYGWDNNFWADIKLKHPFPGSGIDGFDPRIIAVIPANPGYSMDYPVFDVNANNSVIFNPDGYTKLWDDPIIPGNTNPFIAYFKDEPFRVWSSTHKTEEVKRWELNLIGFAGHIKFKLVVDVSTLYPKPPQPIIQNAPEPIEINASVGFGMDTLGGGALIDATIIDWQGDIDRVYAESPDLFNSLAELFFSESGPGENEYIYSGIISNSNFAPAGTYNVLICATDKKSGLCNYQEFQVTVNEEMDFFPYTIYSSWSSDYSYDVAVSDGYAYMTSYDVGLEVFDIDPPSDTHKVNVVSLPIGATRVVIEGDFAFVCSDYSGLEIVDISIPESAYLYKEIATSGHAYDAFVLNGYAYVADSYTNAGLTVIDIDPIDVAHVVTTVTGSCEAHHGVYASGNLAFLANREYCSIDIFNISQPETPILVKTVETPGTAWNIIASNGYAFVADDEAGLAIMDISPLEDASVIKVVDTNGRASDLKLMGQYLFISDQTNGFNIINVSSPENAYIDLNFLPEPGYVATFYGITVQDNYAYLAAGDWGFYMVDLNHDDTACLVDKIAISGSGKCISVNNGFALIGINPTGIVAVDMRDPEQAYIISSIPTPKSNPVDIRVNNNYAYVIDEGSSLIIYDISELSDIKLINSVTFTDIKAKSVSSIYDYAVVAGESNDYGIQIYDCSDPYDIVLINKLSTPPQSSYTYKASKIEVKNDYAFIAANYPWGFQVIDIDPPEYAYILYSPNTGSYDDLDLDGNYAYLQCYYWLDIYDISSPEAAYRAGIVSQLPHGSEILDANNGYAIVTGSIYNCFDIVDVDPPSLAHVVTEITHYDEGPVEWIDDYILILGGYLSIYKTNVFD